MECILSFKPALAYAILKEAEHAYKWCLGPEISNKSSWQYTVGTLQQGLGLSLALCWPAAFVWGKQERRRNGKRHLNPPLG